MNEPVDRLRAALKSGLTPAEGTGPRKVEVSVKRADGTTDVYLVREGFLERPAEGDET